MDVSRKLYGQLLLSQIPTEATLPVLDFILSLFTIWIITFEPLIAQFPSLANS